MRQQCLAGVCVSCQTSAPRSGLKEGLRSRIRDKAGVSKHSGAEIKIAFRDFDVEV
jgi:hypothetical protein